MDEGEYDAVIARINTLNEDSKPEWGRMNVAQMLAHCAEVQEVLNGTKPLKNTPLLLRLVKGMIRKAVVNRVPYKKKSGTHPQYITGNTKQEFQKSKDRLLDAINTERNFSKEEAEAIKHDLFGTMTVEERGVAGWKHVDHHLRQFMV